MEVIAAVPGAEFVVQRNTGNAALCSIRWSMLQQVSVHCSTRDVFPSDSFVCHHLIYGLSSHAFTVFFTRWQAAPSNMSVLFDDSMGTGTLSAAWPAPP